MWNGFIGQLIATTTKNLQRWSIALFWAAVATTLYNSRTFFNVMRGPAQYDETQLASMGGPTFTLRNYATVEGTDTVSTDITEVVTRTTNGKEESKTTTGEYMAMIVGSRILVVKTRPDEKAEKYTGTIVSLPDDFKSKFFSDLNDPKLQHATLPLMLDASEKYGDDLVLGEILIGILLPGTLWTYIKSKRRSEHPETHPLCKVLSQYGSLYTIVPEIDAEARNAMSTLTGVTFTANWVILCSLTSTVAMHRGDIIWAYKKRTKHSVNFIPTGTTYSLVLRDSRGKLVEISSAETNIDAYLNSLADQTPWVIFGYNKKLDKIYKKERSAFAEIVLARKTSMVAGK